MAVEFVKSGLGNRGTGAGGAGQRFRRVFRVPSVRWRVTAFGMVGTYNSRRIGRNRRGRVMMTGFNAVPDRGRWNVTVHFLRFGSPRHRWHIGRIDQPGPIVQRVQVYRLADHRRLLAWLTKLQDGRRH